MQEWEEEYRVLLAVWLGSWAATGPDSKVGGSEGAGQGKVRGADGLSLGLALADACLGELGLGHRGSLWGASGFKERRRLKRSRKSSRRRRDRAGLLARDAAWAPRRVI